MFYIEEVKFNNFRQYRRPEKATVEFVFDKESNRNVNIIEGTGGFGKTNFLSGLLWCFYGDEGKSLTEKFPVLNRLTSDELAEGDKAEVSVEIKINTDGERFLIKRSQFFRKSGSEVYPILTGENKGTKFEIFALDQKNSEVEVRAESFVNILMPKSMREYFFFNGEKLKAYFDTSGHRRIQEAVFNVSQLSVVDRIIHSAQELENKFKKDLNKMPGADQNIAKNLEGATATISNMEKDIKEFSDMRNKLEDKQQHILDEYQKFGGDTATELVKEKRDVEESLNLSRSQRKEKYLELSREISSHSPLIVGIDIIRKASELFKKAEQEKLIPPNVQPEFIDSLINDGLCMCGACLGGNDEAQERLEKLKTLRSAIPNISSHAQSAMQVWAGVSEITSSLLLSKSKAKRLFDEVDKLDKKISDLKLRKESLDVEVSDRAEEIGIEALKSSIKDITDQIAILSQKIGSTEDRLKEQKEIESDLLRKQQKLTGTTQEATLLKRKIDSLQNLILIARHIQTTIMEETRTEISKHTKIFLKELMKNIENVDEIQIDINSDYELTCEVNGHDMILAFSEGQKAALAMSFLMALNKFTGFETPIVFDSALGKIGVSMRKNIANVVPKILDSKQLIFLFLDSEFDDNVKSEMSSTIGTYYKIGRKNGSEQFVTESELVKQN